MQEIDRMLAERACEQLAIAYALQIDFGNYDAAAGLFAPNASLRLGETVLTGQDAIADGLRERFSGYVTRHVCSNILVDVVDPGRAVGITYLSLYRQQHDGYVQRDALGIRGPSLIGHYEDEFLHMHNGWRIGSRRLHVRFRRIRSEGPIGRRAAG